MSSHDEKHETQEKHDSVPFSLCEIKTEPEDTSGQIKEECEDSDYNESNSCIFIQDNAIKVEKETQESDVGNSGNKFEITDTTALKNEEVPSVACGSSYGSVSSLRMEDQVYILIFHNNESFPCSTAGGYQSGKTVFSCNICGKVFKYESKLNRHLVVHTGEKPHKCSECDKSFGSKSVLKDHMFTHSRDMLFSCNDCGKMFIRKSALTVHIQMHMGEKPFLCTLCGKSFARKNCLINHTLYRRNRCA